MRARNTATKTWKSFLHWKKQGSGGELARFGSGGPHVAVPKEAVELRADHPAVVKGHSIFPREHLRDPRDFQRVLIDGRNSSKVGRMVIKGPWAGMPIFTLTLEERATCPRSCDLWRSCYGSGMPYAARYIHGDALEARLAENLDDLADELGRFVVRPHMLGDFYSEEYAHLWKCALDALPGLHVFGYTHWPRQSPIGRRVAAMNQAHPTRCAIRFSVSPEEVRCASDKSMLATTIWREPEGAVVPEGQMCPQQADKTQTCGSCGLCWSPEMRDMPIVFLGHGNTKRGRRKKENDGGLYRRHVQIPNGAIPPDEDVPHDR